MPVLRLLYSQAGRVLRITLGAVLIIVGVSLGGWWWLLAALGLLPLATGALDVCTLGPLFGQPFSGRRFRQTARPR